MTCFLLARRIHARAREHERATHARGSAVAVCLVLCVGKCVCSNPGSRLGGVVWSRCDECRLSWEAGAGAHPRGRLRATSLFQSPVSIILTPHAHKHTHAHSHAHKQLNMINSINSINPLIIALVVRACAARVLGVCSSLTLATRAGAPPTVLLS